MIDKKIYEEIKKFSSKIITENKDEIVFDNEMKQFCKFFKIKYKDEKIYHVQNECGDRNESEAK